MESSGGAGSGLGGGAGDPVAVTRAGVAARVRRWLAGPGAHQWTPRALMVTLAGGACAPLLLTGQADPGLVVLAASTAASVGGNVLSGILTAGVSQLRDQPAETATEVSQDWLEERFTKVLEAGGPRAAVLEAELVRLLDRVGAGQAAVAEAARLGYQDAARQMRASLAQMDQGFSAVISQLEELRVTADVINQAVELLLDRISPPAQAITASAPSTGLLGRPLKEVLSDPRAALDYEVHPAIAPPSSEGGVALLPAYVRRPHDEQLATVISRVRVGNSAAVILVGESSTGKTRACWEALADLVADAPGLAGWRLWHPLTAQDLIAGLAGTDQSGAGPVLRGWTVVWLNELQRYLLPGSEVTMQAAAELRKLLRDRDPALGPVLVVGTIWQDPYWATLTALQTGAKGELLHHAHQLTNLVDDIKVPPDLEGHAREAADQAAVTDARWRAAMRDAPDRPIQYLAGAEYLRRRYEHATATRRAVLLAAGDARRAGAAGKLPLAFIQAAAEGYLSDEAWGLLPTAKQNAAVWVGEAIHGDPEDPEDVGLVRGGLGVHGPLRPVRYTDGPPSEPAYELADFLVQHLGRTRVCIQPCNSLWHAAARVSDADLIHHLARGAQARARLRPAAALYAVAGAAGHADAWTSLGELRERAGDQDGAERAYQQAVEAGDPAGWTELARLREQAGDRTGAEDTARRAAAAGDSRAWRELARARSWEGDLRSAEDAARQAVASGDTYALAALADMRRYRWRREQARDPADEFIEPLPEGGTGDWIDLATTCELRGDPAGSEEYAQVATINGFPDAWHNLAVIRKQAGDWAGAANAYQKAAAAGHAYENVAPGFTYADALVKLHEQEGNREDADRIRRFGITADGLPEVSL